MYFDQSLHLPHFCPIFHQKPRNRIDARLTMHGALYCWTQSKLLNNYTSFHIIETPLPFSHITLSSLHSMIDNKYILVEDHCFYARFLLIIGNKYILLKKSLRRPADAQLHSIPKRKYGENDEAFQLLLDIDCIIKTKGSLPTQAVSHRRKNDGCVCRSVKLHVCKNSLSRIFQFVKINELYNIYIYSPE